MSGTAGASGPVTDYASYPEPLPFGCWSGYGSLEGLRFDNGRGDTAPTLGDLPVSAGDVVTMSWDAFAAGCAADDGTPLVSVSLAAYRNTTLQFDPTVDEELIDGWGQCGAGAAACEQVGGRYQLSVVVPDTGTEPHCSLQLDAVLGAPLAIVGPSGSFYSSTARGDDKPSMLISAKNMAIPCDAPGPQPKPTPEVPQLPEPQPQVPTPVPTPAPEAPAPSAPAPQAPAPAPAPIVIPQAPAVEVLAERVEVPRTLPATGPRISGLLAGLGAALIGSGIATRRASRRLAG
ncbi:MAG: hypothetical protein OEY23_00845 [Acidimicrobiia bacterium]|nr:hypothetical protein [Acidimicrobiia bacterium]